MDDIVKRAAAFAGPKSLCQCGHSGDGNNSGHHNTMQAGHGSCKTCISGKRACVKFSYKGPMLAFSKHMGWAVK